MVAVRSLMTSERNKCSVSTAKVNDHVRQVPSESLEIIGVGSMVAV